MTCCALKRCEDADIHNMKNNGMVNEKADLLESAPFPCLKSCLLGVVIDLAASCLDVSNVDNVALCLKIDSSCPAQAVAAHFAAYC